MRISLPAKLMTSYLAVAGLIIAPSLWTLRSSLTASLEQAESAELKAHVEAVRDRLALLPPSVAPATIDGSVRDVAALIGLRVTYMLPDGRVISDSDVAPERVPLMENHRDRPEMATALAGGYGHARRKSATLGDELLYAAVPLPASGPVRAVVRVAQRASILHASVANAMLALRVASGVGISVAIFFSLIAALFVSTPLRHMRDAARSFAQAKWVTMPPVHSGDELEDLSVALVELGNKVREQLVEVGAQEALVSQAVQEFPLPAMLLRPDLQPMLVNGAFRRFAGLDAANEGQRLTELVQSPRLLAARALSERTGLPTELALAPPDAPTEAGVKGALVPLTRPNAEPLWLLVADVRVPETEARGPEAVQRLLRSAEVQLEKLWEAHPELRPALAQLRVRLDEAAHAAGRPEAVGVEPVGVRELLQRCADEVRLLHPEPGARLALDADVACKVAESAGLAARALRLFVGGALRALPPGRTLELSAETGPTEVKLVVEGAAPADLKPIRELARALGTDVGRVPNREREAAWLTLPRA